MSECRKTIDWTAVHRRLRASEQAMQDVLHPSVEAVREELVARAARLAAPRLSAADQRDGMTLLVFHLGDERFAVELKYVREVGPLDQCTPVPGAAAHVVGVVCHRGEVRSVIDLPALLGRPSAAPDERRFFLHLCAAGRQVLLRVDALDGVLTAHDADLCNLPDGQTPVTGAYFKTVHRDGIVVLDGEALASCGGKSNPNHSKESEASHAHVGR